MIYLDYNATTPLDPRVLEAMLPYLRERFGNAASRHHSLGCEAATAVEAARAQVAAVIGADPREIVWTSGATESVNLAIKGALAAKKGAHVVTAATEHRAGLDVCEFLESTGVRVTYLRVEPDGTLDLGRLSSALAPDTALVSLMAANNETGVLHPVREIGALCKSKGVLFHTDATQAFGKEPIDVRADGIDLLSLSGHKICGPKGVGALYVRRKEPRVRLEPLLHGGGHEMGRRSGTLNVPAVVGLGAAAEIAARERAVEQPRIRALRDRLEAALVAAGAVVNGSRERRLAGTTNLGFPGVDGDALMKRMPDVAVSASSACTSAQLQPSYVLGAMGLPEDRIRSSLRLSLGRFTTEAEIDAAVRRVNETATQLR